MDPNMIQIAHDDGADWTACHCADCHRLWSEQRQRVAGNDPLATIRVPLWILERETRFVVGRCPAGWIVQDTKQQLPDCGPYRLRREAAESAEFSTASDQKKRAAADGRDSFVLTNQQVQQNGIILWPQRNSFQTSSPKNSAISRSGLSGTTKLTRMENRRRSRNKLIIGVPR